MAIEASVSNWGCWDRLTTAVVVLNGQGQIVWCNQSAQALIGYSLKVLEGKSIAAFFKEGDHLLGQIVNIPPNAHFRHVELMQLIHHDRQGTTSVFTTLTIQPAEEVPIVLELSNAQVQKALIHETHVLELSDAYRRLLRNLAHEIKNPLGGLRGAAQLLQHQVTDSDLIEYAGVIIDEADRLQLLLDRVLEPYRVPRRVEHLNIHEITEHVRLIMAAECGTSVSLVRDYDASVPDLWGDRAQLIQVVLNVVRNAVESVLRSVPEGTVRRVELKTRVVRHVLIAKKNVKLAVELKIKDNGEGIPEDIQPYVFDPLVSGRDGGTGLGLNIAQTFMQQNNGHIEFSSCPGSTEFRIVLPIE